ncbi:TetR/AcrR family transcriptional regulator [Eubacterium sp.]|uniref:TetR/AcrR family transcriptional regulator n=1 Tax=Eubacterium sp. TaxID=142586 RepID=UPI0025EF1F8D|nr:TetR/AcrR family transcriptional regulator [Eubacterium sp.]MCR5629795.1 TetR/AcrR family transcriptional regulator [Eubacterium sp.]
MTRQEQKEAKKKAILVTALELFVTRGYYETKITDIAKAVPMSVGLMFHYFESKEQLLLELVKVGYMATNSTDKLADVPPEQYFDTFLNGLFAYAKNEPWVFNMFILMNQARREGMPEEARTIALSIDQIEKSAKVIRKGQKTGVFRKGDAKLLATCFWASVQGIMEEMANDDNMKTPKPEWIVSILKA